MNICVIGAGYVGLTTAAVVADFGHHVHCVDVNPEKINMLNQGRIPIYEPGLQEIILRNVEQGRLYFSTEIKDGITHNPIILIAVGTPARSNGSTNLTYIQEVVESIAQNLSSYKIIITKSTVPLGTNEWIHQTFLNHPISEDLFDVVSNPEFLKEGTALQDLLHPDKIVIGSKRERPINVIKSMYKEINAPYILTNLTGAELIKYASNAFLATKISFINEIARICDAYHVDVKDIAKGLGTDPRIGPYFLNAGLGYGGSCLPKDISSLTFSAQLKNINTEMLHAVTRVNETQIIVYKNKLLAHFSDLNHKQITILGVAFKPNTDDLRCSPAVALIHSLQQEGCQIHTYDPIVTLNHEQVTAHTNIYDSVHNSHAVILATDWPQFQEIDWVKVKTKMKDNVIVDGRNCLDPETMRAYGFQYVALGDVKHMYSLNWRNFQ